MIGRSLGHYSIVEKLGEGGMGAVYKALDTRLERPIALKILPADKMADPDRRRRFTQEAKAASALNHPNIVTIYDIGESEGTYFIAMEYVQGQTLDRLIGRKGLALGEALGYAIQIADGLGKAHAAGIVHRDLKPSNLMVTPDGLVKILDFGLAKLVETPEPGGDAGATLTLPRTPATEEGVILGTVAYMSPEQAAGKTVDARSDIFSFGSVLYEMLTGRRAFDGETKASTLAAVIALDPAPPAPFHGSLPSEVERVIMRALRKDPQRRWQNMADLKIALQDLKEDSESGRLTVETAAPRRVNRRAWFLAGLVGLVVLAAGGIVAWRALKPASGPPAAKAERISFEPGFTFWAAISPDGKMMAYTTERDGNFDIYVRQMSGSQAIRRTLHPAPDWFANFSPDGSKIVFRSEREGGGIYLMEALAGPEHKIADDGTLPAFSPDGSMIAYFVGNPLSRVARLFVVPAAGGPSRALVPDYIAVARGSTWSPPFWSADGKTILLDGMKEGDRTTRSWWLVPVDGGPPVRVEPPSQSGQMVRVVSAWWNGDVYYSDGSTIGGMTMFRVPLSSGSHPVAGPPQIVTSPAGMQWGASISLEGRMVFSTMSPSVNIWAVPLKPGEETASGPPERVTSDSWGKLNVAASADGSRVAWVAYSFSPNRFEVRIRDVATGREDSIATANATIGLNPCLSPDGSRLGYADIVDGKRTNFIVENGAEPRKYAGEGLILGFFSKARDVFSVAGNQLLRLDSAGNRVNIVLDATGTGALHEAALSPADTEIAFTVARPDGSAVLFAAPVGDRPAEPETWIVLEEGRHYIGSPSWSLDGRTLFYASNRDDFFCIWARRFTADGRPSGEPFAAFHDHKPPDSNLWKISFMAAGRDRLYLFLSEFKGDLWSLKLKK